MNQNKILWVIPTPIGPGSRDFAPVNVLQKLEVIFCESERTAKKFLSSKGVSFKNVRFFEFRKIRSTAEAVEIFEQSRTFGIICDAGFPAVADAGSEIVYLAHSLNIDVRPLPGPNSIIMALSASGLDGNRFEFFGYPPIPQKEIRIFLKKLEKLSHNKSCIFIEAPQRSAKTYRLCLDTLIESTILSVAISLDHTRQKIRTGTVASHNKDPLKIEKEPAVFMIGQPKKVS